MKTVLLLRTDGMGRAEGDLPRTLVAKYLSLLADKEPLPAAMCFYTDGVKLAVKGSPVLEQLRVLEYGYPIKVAVTQYDSPEIDLPEDIERVEAILGNDS